MIATTGCDEIAHTLGKDTWSIVLQKLAKEDYLNLTRTCKFLWRIGHQRHIVQQVFANHCKNISGLYSLPFTKKSILDSDILDGCVYLSAIDNLTLSFVFKKPFQGFIQIFSLKHNIFTHGEGFAVMRFSS
jgi:hypothetical protein